LLLHLKSFLAGWQFHNSEVIEAITTCLASQAASFYDEGIQKLVQSYDKCFNNGGNYVKSSVRCVRSSDRACGRLPSSLKKGTHLLSLILYEYFQ
jgi:hypothetical protein